MKLYYKIWVDCIQRARAQAQNKKDWKIYTMVFMSMAMALNFILFMAILQRNVLHKSFYNLDLDIFPGTKLDAVISFLLLFLLPPLAINYLLIFRNNKYEYLIQKYPYHNGKLFIGYFLGSLAFPFILLLIGYFLEKFN
ncbi:hypothetical protein D3C71_52760 [compost metagenome]